MSDINENSNKNTKEIAKKIPKKKGPFRTEAVIPFFIVAVLCFVYFHFFFDLHLKKAFEFAGYELLGAEVNVANVETSFLNGTFRVRGIQITNAEKPTHNMVSVGDVRFGVLWDGLFRARIVVEEMAVEQIEIGSPRKTPGKVKPPEPPPPLEDPNKPSALSKAISKAKDQTLNTVEKKYNQNMLGDIASLLGGTSGGDQLNKIEDSLPSKARLSELNKEFQEKQKKWDEKIKSLPKGPEIQALGDRLGKVKIKDFKTPQELQQSISEIDSILKEADAKYKLVQSTGGGLSEDLKKMDSEIKELDQMVRKDIQDLESRFRLPKLDAKSLSESIFRPYLQPYLNQFARYQGLFQKYAPPNLMKKKNDSEPEIEIQPHPRSKGVSYEFGRKNSYPLFWIKKISISSQASSGSPYSGNIKGKVIDITSNQALIGKPTIITVEGDFPAQEVSQFQSKLTIDNLKAQSRISYDFSVGGYGITGRDLVQSSDVQVAFKKATGSISSNGELLGLRDFSFALNNQIKNVDYSISAKNTTVEEILKGVFSGLPGISLDATGKGILPSLDLSINSNLGPELQRGFEKQLQKKLDEARAKLQAFVDEQVGKEKAKLEGEFNKMKSQIDGEIKKIQDQINSEKAKGQGKVDLAKKDAENQSKKGLEDQVKKAIGPDGDKKLDDLKKRFGL